VGKLLQLGPRLRFASQEAMFIAIRQRAKADLNLDIDPEVGGVVSPASFEVLLAAFGVRCAAWLLWAHRRRVRRMGGMLLRMPATEPAPLWFQLAVECFKRRPRWVVAEQVRGEYSMVAIAQEDKK
jgi:hypothetical protein